LPNNIYLAGEDFYETYDPGNDPRLRKKPGLPNNAAIAGWSISMTSQAKNEGHTQFVKRQIAAGYPVFASAGNDIFDRELMTAFISPEHAIGVGGNSCQGDTKAELVTNEHTDVSFVNPYKKGDCQTVTDGTSFSAPHAAGVGLPHMLKDFRDDGKLNGTTIPEGFRPQLTFPVTEASHGETLSQAAPRTSTHEASRSPPR